MEPVQAQAAPQSAAAPVAAAKPPKPAETSKAAISSDFETFLKMLTAQMENQDPLNPIDSADYAVQLATFSGVEQQVRTNDLLAAMGTQMQVGGLSSLAGWVGMEARAKGPAQFAGSPITISPKANGTADRAELVVRDAAGIEVQRQQIPISSEPIEWAGVGSDGRPVPPGVYSFEIVSEARGEVISRDTPEVYSRVREVRTDGTESLLVLDGGILVRSTDVTALREG